MDFSHDLRTEGILENLDDFLRNDVGPAEQSFRADLANLEDRWAWSTSPTLTGLREHARSRGLWNLFLPGQLGGGLTNLQYAPLAELTGRYPHLGPAALNCAAPDTGNIEVLTLVGTPEQRETWLEPLLDASIRSAFAMTEPDVGSSDATNIATRIERDGDEYVITGRKWWVTGAMNPESTVLLVLGLSDPDAARHRRHTLVLVPRDTPGVRFVRPMEVFGYDDHEHGGHAEIEFDRVRVPVSNLLGEEGGGFAIAQARLGPGRIHHCMRAIGAADLAIDLMCDRAADRVTFGRSLASRGVIREWVAESQVRVEQLRLLVLQAAWKIDAVGARAAHREIQAIKVATPSTVQWVIDKAIQVHGAAGLSQDYPLAGLFASARSLRFADGPDEVHKRSLGSAEIARRVRNRPQREAG